jgi:hypothetical protein
VRGMWWILSCGFRVSGVGLSVFSCRSVGSACWVLVLVLVVRCRRVVLSSSLLPSFLPSLSLPPFLPSSFLLRSSPSGVSCAASSVDPVLALSCLSSSASLLLPPRRVSLPPLFLLLLLSYPFLSVSTSGWVSKFLVLVWVGRTVVSGRARRAGGTKRCPSHASGQRGRGGRRAPPVKPPGSAGRGCHTDPAKRQRRASENCRGPAERASRGPAEPSRASRGPAEPSESRSSRAERVEVERRARQGVLARWSDRGLPSLRTTEQRHETETVEAVRVWSYSATGRDGLWRASTTAGELLDDGGLRRF